MDNVVSFQVVLPNATLATASATVHSDLFWGLKGGFNNFGEIIYLHDELNAGSYDSLVRYRDLGSC